MEKWQSQAYCAGLENRRAGNRPGGSNPSFSAFGPISHKWKWIWVVSPQKREFEPLWDRKHGACRGHWYTRLIVAQEYVGSIPTLHPKLNYIGIILIGKYNHVEFI